MQYMAKVSRSGAGSVRGSHGAAHDAATEESMGKKFRLLWEIVHVSGSLDLGTDDECVLRRGIFSRRPSCLIC